MTYGETIRLLGYTARTEGGQLVLELAWLAMEAPESDYKVFVHLIDPDDGRTVAQVDTMPRNWSYPTSRWGRGEVFVDRVEMDVSGLPGGAYRLAIGLYVPEGERLPARDGQGALLPDGRALLEDEVEVGRP